jgi:hypothetical protein
MDSPAYKVAGLPNRRSESKSEGNFNSFSANADCIITYTKA